MHCASPSRAVWPVSHRKANIFPSDYNHFLICTDSIDCSDRRSCHLAWFIRDNRHLLPFVLSKARCSNGTFLEGLDPSGFNHCEPVSIVKTSIYFNFKENNIEVRLGFRVGIRIGVRVRVGVEF